MVLLKTRSQRFRGDFRDDRSGHDALGLDHEPVGPTETTTVLPRASPRNAAFTTSSAVCTVRKGGRSIFDAAKKFVSVTPGHNASTRIPYERFSSDSASENDNTNAFVAAYVAMNGTPWNEAVEATLMIVPWRRSRIGPRNR